MDTKEKIILAAIELYNSKGINATTRHIAEKISISAGNLHYHFKHTDDIIIELYNRLSAEFDQLMKSFDGFESINHEMLKSFSDQSFIISYKYRFILLNFVEIGKRVPFIQLSYQQLILRREVEFNNIFRKLVASGYFRSDVPDEVWNSLVKQFFIISDFWLSHNELVDRLDEQPAALAYSKLIGHVLFPYLSNPKGI